MNILRCFHDVESSISAISHHLKRTRHCNQWGCFFQIKFSIDVYLQARSGVNKFIAEIHIIYIGIKFKHILKRKQLKGFKILSYGTGVNKNVGIVVQYKRCQRVFHTSNSCQHKFQCVKCKESLPGGCQKNSINNIQVCCVNCGGAHSANDIKNCQFYKDKIEPIIKKKNVNKDANNMMTYVGANWENKNDNIQHKPADENFKKLCLLCLSSRNCCFPISSRSSAKLFLRPVGSKLKLTIFLGVSISFIAFNINIFHRIGAFSRFFVMNFTSYIHR